MASAHFDELMQKMAWRTSAESAALASGCMGPCACPQPVKKSSKLTVVHWYGFCPSPYPA